MRRSGLVNLTTEMNGCMGYFLNCISQNRRTYGLVLDAYPEQSRKSSIAATGFGLAAFSIAAYQSPFLFKSMYNRCVELLKTLKTLAHDHGFFYHFYDTETGEVYNNCEVSTIDTAILICGAVTAGEFFGGEVKALSDELYSRVDWRYFIDEKNKRFYMAKYGDSFTGHWDAYAEQLMMYVLSAACPKEEYRVDKEIYYNVRKFRGRYKQYEFIYTWSGSLFVHQFSHAFIDFKGLKDLTGTDWYENSVKAVLASRQYCVDNTEGFKGYGKNSWGLTSCAAQGGYCGNQGTPPSGNNNTEHRSDGTVAPYGAAASIIFAPKYAIRAIDHYYKDKNLYGEYGLKAAYNLDSGWYSEKYIGIDKGVTLMMLSNYFDGFVQRSFMKNPFVAAGLNELGFSKPRKERAGRIFRPVPVPQS